MSRWKIETIVTQRRVYIVEAQDEASAIAASTDATPEYEEDLNEETETVVLDPSTEGET